jgi:phospholipase/carboxylesterase
MLGLNGGLVGDKTEETMYSGSFENCRIFLGCSDIDSHIPLERVNQSEIIMRKLNGSVTKRIYKGMGHTINEDELNFIRSIL